MLQINTDLDKILIGLPLQLKIKRSTLEEIAEIYRKDIEQNILQGTGLDGSSLAPNKHRGRLLFHTGELSKSIKVKVYENQAIIYSSLPYARYVNQGTKYMPSRVFWGQSNRASINLDKYFISRTLSQIFLNFYIK